MVAAARLRRAQERAAASRPYAIKIKEVLSSRCERSEHPCSLSAKNTRCFNIVMLKKLVIWCSPLIKVWQAHIVPNALKKAVAEISECEHDVVIITSGRKARDFFQRRGYKVLSSHFGYSDRPSYANAVEIAQDAIKQFADEHFDELHIVFTLFKTALSQIPTSDKILPVEPPVKEKGKASASFIFEPDEDETLQVLAPKYLETVVYAALVQSAASELGSRMTAMSSATDNAGKLVQNLELSYNKARQASITRELNEIVGGVEALKQAQN